MPTPNMRPLTPGEMEILAFARERFRYQGVKDTAVLERFGCSPARFSQRLTVLLDLPAAEAYDPELVRRLRRRRASYFNSRKGTP